MLFLHSQNPPFIHRDLKSPNMLVDENYVLKIGDLVRSVVNGCEMTLDANVKM